MSYEAFVLTEKSRDYVLKQFPPKYPEVIAHHVTHQFGVAQAPSGIYGLLTDDIRVIGYAQEDGIEVLVVSCDGEGRRPDGKRYHITLSLDREKGWKPMDSNQVIQHGFETVNSQMRIEAKFLFVK